MSRRFHLSCVPLQILVAAMRYNSLVVSMLTFPGSTRPQSTKRRISQGIPRGVFAARLRVLVGSFAADFAAVDTEYDRVEAPLHSGSDPTSPLEVPKPLCF